LQKKYGYLFLGISAIAMLCAFPRLMRSGSRKRVSTWRPHGFRTGGFPELDELLERRYRKIYTGARLTVREQREEVP